MDFEFIEENGTNGSIKVSLLGKYDSSLLDIEWYENQEKIDSYKNQNEVVFSRPETNEITRYTWKIKDLTGAGDLFASGFLDSHVKGKKLSECLQNGTKMSSKIIEVIGARLN